MILDDQRLFLESWPEAVFSYSKYTHDYIDGIAVHWYLDSFVSPKILGNYFYSLIKSNSVQKSGRGKI